jgi:hypothetical protein
MEYVIYALAITIILIVVWVAFFGDGPPGGSVAANEKQIYRPRHLSR